MEPANADTIAITDTIRPAQFCAVTVAPFGYELAVCCSSVALSTAISWACIPNSFAHVL
jgi:hypothetical protein